MHTQSSTELVKKMIAES